MTVRSQAPIRQQSLHMYQLVSYRCLAPYDILVNPAADPQSVRERFLDLYRLVSWPDGCAAWQTTMPSSKATKSAVRARQDAGRVPRAPARGRGAQKGTTLRLPESNTDNGIGIATPGSGAGKRCDLMRVVAFPELRVMPGRLRRPCGFLPRQPHNGPSGPGARRRPPRVPRRQLQPAVDGRPRPRRPPRRQAHHEVTRRLDFHRRTLLCGR
jgi:hypothetical protein